MKYKNSRMKINSLQNNLSQFKLIDLNRYNSHIYHFKIITKSYNVLKGSCMWYEKIYNS